MDRRQFLKFTGLAGANVISAPLMAGGTADPSFLLKQAKAKRVIFLTMSGGFSQFETFDNKPVLKKFDGKLMPPSFLKGQQLAQLQDQKKILCYGPQFKFNKCGQSGLEMTELFPHLATVADDLAIVKSAYTEQINHDPAISMLNAGTFLNGRPSMGSWINYALGNNAEGLPGFVVLESVKGRGPQPLYARLWNNGFLDSIYQGVKFNSKGDTVHYAKNPAGIDRIRQGQLIKTINKLNQFSSGHMDDDEIATRMQQYDMAFKMQKTIPELADMSQEPSHVLDLYGCKPGDGSFASNCLMARKLAERDVRFIQLYHRGWDHHNGIRKYMPICAEAVDQGTAALIKDLKDRDMLKDTLIVFAGEFGRTPMSQTNKGDAGRDHHMNAMSLFMCGGGIKGGMTYGETDELGYKPVKDAVHVRDVHATMLHLLGINHKKLTVRFQGLDNRLTGVEEAHVIKKLLV
ncbi:DUF1501 domain-containing protein [Lentisphaera profundi]|uniref:DUF1501 domain-containing protein n=1 Tax=Lentisphaera profundi TaxID=1658616 RepID=A0ABY7VNU2_9BACT|nr:DUF1501 domain-containing protein [Lentisphaera profundi]WDE95810.1 DUF1501 domain-containing protein [Lentisphaera profundi]